MTMEYYSGEAFLEIIIDGAVQYIDNNCIINLFIYTETLNYSET